MSGVQLTVKLTKAEAAAVARATLSMGYGVVKSRALVAAEAKIKTAISRAVSDDSL